MIPPDDRQKAREGRSETPGAPAAPTLAGSAARAWADAVGDGVVAAEERLRAAIRECES